MAAAPLHIHLHRRSGVLELRYEEEHFELGAEFLRVHSPSAEVRGHGGQGARLVEGKKHVLITTVEPVGNYAIALQFDDGHRSGIYSWDYLYRLATDQNALWQAYLQRLAEAGGRREPLPDGVQVINIQSSTGSNSGD